MGNRTYIWIGALFLLLFFGCEDNILNKSPLDKYSDDNVWGDIELADAYLLNLYDRVGHGYSGEMLSSIGGETLVARGPDGTDYLKGLTSPDNTRGPHLDRHEWGPNFANIQAVNIFLDRIESVPESYDSGEKAEIEERAEIMKGEGLFLRAWFYHQLLRAYGGLPLLEQANVLGDDYSKVIRSSFSETVDFIVSDLNSAAELLLLKNDMEMGRATKEAALTLKSRVLLFAASDLTADGAVTNELVGYLNPNRESLWTAAKNAALDVMNLNTAKLADFGAPDQNAVAENYYELFRSYDLSSEEIIWGRMYQRTVGRTHNHNQTSGPNGNSNFGRNGPIQAMVDSYEMADGSDFFDHFELDDNNYYRNISDSYDSENIYHNREPRFYASVLFDSAVWVPRHSNLRDRDPLGIYERRTRRTERSDGSWSTVFGIDTHNGPVDGWNANYAGYIMKKFMDHESDGSVENNMNVWIELRFSEVLLNYAEACLELGEFENATNAVNQIRHRAGLPDFTGDIKNALRHERKIELAFEESAWYDIRRWKILKDVLSPESVSAGIEIIESRYSNGEINVTWKQINAQMLNTIDVDRMSWLPIDRAEINRAPQLEQNPPWN